MLLRASIAGSRRHCAALRASRQPPPELIGLAAEHCPPVARPSGSCMLAAVPPSALRQPDAIPHLENAPCT